MCIPIPLQSQHSPTSSAPTSPASMRRFTTNSLQGLNPTCSKTSISLPAPTKQLAFLTYEVELTAVPAQTRSLARRRHITLDKWCEVSPHILRRIILMEVPRKLEGEVVDGSCGRSRGTEKGAERV